MLGGDNCKKFIKQLIDHEGLRLQAYLDTMGILTIGVGHNCIAAPVPGVASVGDRITEERAFELLDQDAAEHMAAVDKSLPWIGVLNAPRQAVLYNMSFNLGVKGLLGFSKTLKLVETGHYGEAGSEMLSSKWATQVGRRARQLSRQMILGEWQER